MLILFNLVSDRLVTRYENSAERDPGSPYLKGMTPRELGPTDATRAVLFVHGFLGSQTNFHDLPDEVASAGWYVRTMRLPGHGTSPRDFERTSADDLQAGVLDEVRGMKKRFETVVLVGHSLGGALVTLAAAEEPVEGVVLCSPFFGLSINSIVGIPSEKIIRSAATVLRWVPRPPGRAPVNLKENWPYIDAYHWIPVQGALAALDAGARADSTAILERITCPTLLIHARRDTVTSPEAAAKALDRMGSSSKKIIWLEKSDHVIFWDYEEATVTHAVLQFLKEVESHGPDQPRVSK